MDKYIDKRAAQSWRRDVVDQVAIMTDWMDGDLVRRAVEEALGESKPMIGGSFSDLTVAADGAARLALIRRQNLLEMQGYLAHGEL
jgi:Trp operon repressor